MVVMPSRAKDKADFDSARAASPAGQIMDQVRAFSSRTPRPILRLMSVRSVTPLA